MEKCGLCDGTFRFSWKTSDPTGRVWNYESCDHCGWIRLAVDISDPVWKETAYTADYYGGGYSKFTGAIQWLRELSARRRADELARFFSKPGRVLDIGCGEGLFLQNMKKLGWQVDGCEISDTAARRTEERIGQPVHRGGFETMKVSGRPWDMVMLWHVLEHVSQPETLLREIHAATAPGAMLVIGIPNADSWQARLFGPDWFHLDPPRHLYSMNLSHLRQLAGRAGFEEMEIHHFSLEYNPFGWAQSFLNRLGFKRDAMYEILKSRSPVRAAKPTGNSELRTQDSELSCGGWGIRVLAWLLLGPSILPAILEAAAKCGGAMAVYFRRKRI